MPEWNGKFWSKNEFNIMSAISPRRVRRFVSHLEGNSPVGSRLIVIFHFMIRVEGSHVVRCD